VSGTIGYLDAWSLWLSGQQPPGDWWMGPMTIRWWSRIGKIATFIGGGTVVLDLVGPTRLKRWASQARRSGDRIRDWAPPLALSMSIFLLLIIIIAIINSLPVPPLTAAALLGVVALTFGTIANSEKIFVGIAGLLEKTHPGTEIRVAATCLLAAGFHFDLLAS
jgi:hypothetical protein